MATILLIEDDPALVHIMTAILDSNGHTVHAAGTAAEGLAALECAPPELVLLDLTLPDTDGLVLLTKLSRHDGCARPAVIVVSGRNTQSDRVLGLRFGADDYIVKPFDVEELNARIEAVLRRARRPQPLAGLL